MTKKINIEIKITGIKVDKKYFNFKYEAWVNNKHIFKNEEYESSHDWGKSKVTMNKFKNELKRYYAFNLVMELVTNDINIFGV